MRRILGGLLLLQVLIMGSLAVLAQVIFEGIGPDDDVLPQTEYEARARLAGVVIGVMVLLGSVALFYVAQWVRNRSGVSPWPLVFAHAAAALVFALFQWPLAAVLLVLAGAAWWGADAVLRSRSTPETTPEDRMMGAS